MAGAATPACPACQTPTTVVYIGPADRLDGGQATVWHCRICPHDFAIPATCWAAINPDRLGDLWTCQHSHEFVLTPEGLVITPGDGA